MVNCRDSNPNNAELGSSGWDLIYAFRACSGKQLLPQRLVALTPHERVRRVLARFDAWLTERVDVQQRAAHHRLQLVEIEQLAQDGGIDGWHLDCEVRPLRLSERPRRRQLLSLKELTQFRALQVLQLGNPGRYPFDHYLRAVFRDSDEADEFVVWAFRVELDLGMLVDGS